MEGIQAILERLNLEHGYDTPKTAEEWAKFKANSFNESAGELDKEDGYNCPICHNKGWIDRAVQMENGSWTVNARHCKCMAVRLTIKRMEKSGLKNIIRDYTFDKYEAAEAWQEKIKASAMDYANAPDGWFFIGGQSGCGKTHLCTAICRKFLLEGKAVKYMLWRDEITKLKSLVTESDEYQTAVDKYKKTDVLYIDDLFKTGKDKDGHQQRPTTGDVNAAFEILNFRYNDPKLLTIISSECTMQDILDIDEATGGRIFERAGNHSFSISKDRAKNYRLKGVTEL